MVALAERPDGATAGDFNRVSARRRHAASTSLLRQAHFPHYPDMVMGVIDRIVTRWRASTRMSSMRRTARRSKRSNANCSQLFPNCRRGPSPLIRQVLRIALFQERPRPQASAGGQSRGEAMRRPSDRERAARWGISRGPTARSCRPAPGAASERRRAVARRSDASAERPRARSEVGT
jgi:hypothetical protein